MIILKNSHDNWEFRALRNGQVECRNEKKEMDWAVRGAAEIGYFDDHLAIIWDALNGLTATLPQEGFSIPVVEPLAVQQPQEYNQNL